MFVHESIITASRIMVYFYVLCRQYPQVLCFVQIVPLGFMFCVDSTPRFYGVSFALLFSVEVLYESLFFFFFFFFWPLYCLSFDLRSQQTLEKTLNQRLIRCCIVLLDINSLCIDFRFLVFNVTFSNISAISWQPVLVVVEAGVPGENH